MTTHRGEYRGKYRGNTRGKTPTATSHGKVHLNQPATATRPLQMLHEIEDDEAQPRTIATPTLVVYDGIAPRCLAWRPINSTACHRVARDLTAFDGKSPNRRFRFFGHHHQRLSCGCSKGNDEAGVKPHISATSYGGSGITLDYTVRRGNRNAP